MLQMGDQPCTRNTGPDRRGNLEAFAVNRFGGYPQQIQRQIEFRKNDSITETTQYAMNFPGGSLNLNLRFLTQSRENHHEISDCPALRIDSRCALAKWLRCIENRQA